jgi:hypothetical protein
MTNDQPNVHRPRPPQILADKCGSIMDNEVQGTPGWPLPPLRTNESPCDNVGKRMVVKTMAFPVNVEIGSRKQKFEPEPTSLIQGPPWRNQGRQATRDEP